MSDERIYQIGKPIKFFDKGYTTVWSIPPSKNDGHVCSFPDELVKRCLEMYTEEGGTVFDPFMGSGTTVKVANDMKRNSIGIEMGCCEKKGHKYEGIHWVDVVAGQLNIK